MSKRKRKNYKGSAEDQIADILCDLMETGLAVEAKECFGAEIRVGRRHGHDGCVLTNDGDVDELFVLTVSLTEDIETYFYNENGRYDNSLLTEKWKASCKGLDYVIGHYWNQKIYDALNGISKF